MGISIVNVGSGTVSLVGNTVSGTRRQATIGGDGAAGNVGDGVSIVASGAHTRAGVEMMHNTVGANARLGVIAHGEGVRLEVSQTRFGAGNGYGQMLPGNGGTLDLAAQNDADVTGGDNRYVEVVEGVFVADAVPSGVDDD